MRKNRMSRCFGLPPALVRIVATLLCLALCSLMTGCGDDGGGGFKPESPFRELTSPENVLHNFETAYDERDYDHFAPLIRDGYTFVFNQDDVLSYPGDIPSGGIWGKAEELQAHHNMLDTAYVPSDPGLRIAALTLDLAVSGNLEPSTGVVAPPGTRKGFATLDLRVHTAGEIDYIVNSRPLFYFTPDSTVTPVTWSIWRIEDAPFGAPYPRGASPDPFSTHGDGNRGAVDRSDKARAEAARERSSWGAIKAVYANS